MDNVIKQMFSFQKNVLPDPSKSCGPYKPRGSLKLEKRAKHNNMLSHDTIGRF